MCPRTIDRVASPYRIREYDVGFVIITSDLDYPNFRRGYYCVVEGPMSRGRALSEADRALDFAPTVYAGTR